MVIRNLNDTGLFAVIVPAEEIFLAIPRKEGNGYGMIFPPADVNSARVIRAAVNLAGNWPAGEFGLSMLHGPFRRRGKQHLVILICVNCRVDPEQERLGFRRSVEEL